MVARSRSIRYRSSPGGATLFTPDQFSFIQGELARISAALQGVDDHIESGEITLAGYTDATRPAAGDAGRIIFNSDDKIFNVDDGTQWWTVDRTNSVILSDTTVSDDATEQTIYTGDIATGSLHVGNYIKTFVSGTLSNNSAADDLTIKIYMGTTLLQTYAPAIGNVTSQPWHVDLKFTVRSVGGSGSIAMHTMINLAGSTAMTDTLETIDTDADESITITIQWNNAKTDNIITARQGALEYKH